MLYFSRKFDYRKSLDEVDMDLGKTKPLEFSKS